MDKTTSQKILDYIAKNNQASGKELVDYLGGIGPRAVRKQLKTLFDKGLLSKVGRPPRVYYLLKVNREVSTVGSLDEKTLRIINEKDV